MSLSSKHSADGVMTQQGLRDAHGIPEPSHEVDDDDEDGGDGTVNGQV